MLNKTQFIVEELLNRNLISSEKIGEVTNIVNGDFQSKEYNLKKQIEDALSGEIHYYGLKSTVDLEDINGVYGIITSKFKEDITPSRQDIIDQVKQYYVKKYRYKNNVSSNKETLAYYINPFKFTL